MPRLALLRHRTQRVHHGGSSSQPATPQPASANGRGTNAGPYEFTMGGLAPSAQGDRQFGCFLSLAIVLFQIVRPGRLDQVVPGEQLTGLYCAEGVIVESGT